MKQKIEITTCDICGKNHNDVNTEAGSGFGSLKFDWCMGAYGGGASDTISLPDLCYNCTHIMRCAIDKVVFEIKGKYV